MGNPRSEFRLRHFPSGWQERTRLSAQVKEFYHLSAVESCSSCWKKSHSNVLFSTLLHPQDLASRLGRCLLAAVCTVALTGLGKTKVYGSSDSLRTKQDLGIKTGNLRPTAEFVAVILLKVRRVCRCCSL